MADAKSSFWQRYGIIFTLLLTTASILGGLVYAAGRGEGELRKVQSSTDEAIKVMHQHIDRIDVNGSRPVPLMKASLDAHEREIAAIKVLQLKQADDMYQIKSDVRLVAEWVRQQQQAQAEKRKP